MNSWVRRNPALTAVAVAVWTNGLWFVACITR